ncbi:hypothetical protein JL722_14922 [Aureococcus anophagefferens]|nr:hypothetical protein JL722_14922 [Aureococcus anophagefferens]
MFVKLAKMYGTYNDQGVSIRKQLAALSMRTLGGPTELQLELDDLSQLYEDTCGHALPEGQVRQYFLDGMDPRGGRSHPDLTAAHDIYVGPTRWFEGERGFASPAWLAALGNHAAVVEELAKFVDLKDVAHPQNGWSPLHVAVEKGHLEVLEALASAGQDLNRRTHDSYAPIHRAAYLGRADVAGVLADYGADLGRVDARRRVRERPRGVRRRLGGRGRGSGPPKDDSYAPLHLAAYYGHADVVEVLARRGADVDARNPEGSRRTPPPRSGHGAVLRALKAAGADLGRRNAKGLTPAFMAAQYGMADALVELARSGADLDAADDSGWTPEMVSIHQGHVDTLAIFTEARTKKLENRTSAPDDVGEEDEAGCGGWTWKTRLGWVALSVAASLSTVLVADAAEGKRRRAPPDDGRSAELQRALDAANSELRELGVEIDAERIARDAAEARAKDAEASRAAAAAVARTREAKAKEREAKLAGDLRDLRKRRDRRREGRGPAPRPRRVAAPRPC